MDVDGNKKRISRKGKGNLSGRKGDDSRKCEEWRTAVEDNRSTCEAELGGAVTGSGELDGRKAKWYKYNDGRRL